MTERLWPEVHVRKIAGEAYNLVRSIRTAFRYLDEDMIKRLIITMIRPRLEYAAVVWSPSTVRGKKILECVQRAVTKLPPTLTNLSYEQRLKK